MRRNRFLAAVAVATVAIAIAGPVVSSADAGLVPVLAYTGSNNRDNFGGNMSDLFSGEEMTKTDPDDPSTWTATLDHYSHEWQTASLLSGAANGKIAWTVLDFGSSVANLENMYFWNIREGTGQNRRTVDYNIYYADSPVVAPPAAPTDATSVDYDFSTGGWTVLTGTPLTMPQRGPAPDPANQVVPLGDISARYIGVEILTNDGGSRAGLSEVAVTAGLGGPPPEPEPLLIDFNSTNQDGGPHNQAGYQAYDARHEVASDFIPQTYAAFGTTVTLTPDWPNTTDNRVQQMIDRGAGNDANWNNAAGDLDLVTDFLGIDTRTGNGGNGNWDGTTGTPTYMTLALSGLPAGPYEWRSYHHDTEHVHGNFTIELSTDGGATYVMLDNGLMTDSTPGGNPDSSGFTPPGPWSGPDASLLPSTYQFGFVADGVNDVVLRFAPLANTAVHRQIWGINGFELRQAEVIPEPATLSLLGLGSLLALRRRRKAR